MTDDGRSAGGEASSVGTGTATERASIVDSTPTYAATKALLGLDEEYAPGCLEDTPPEPKVTAKMFEQMLRGRGMAPWRPEFFLDHCETELNAESLFFWNEVEGLRRSCGDKSAHEPPAEHLRIDAKHRSDSRSWAAMIVETYVQDNSPEQVNISAGLRAETIKRAKEFDMHGASAFDAAQREVFNLMHQDIFPRFAKSVLSTNLSQPESRHRRHAAAAIIALALAGQALCLGFFVHRAYLVLFLPAWFLALHKLWSAHLKLCVLGSMLGGRFIGLKFFPVECPVARTFNRRRAKVLFIKVFSVACLMTLLPILITFIVDAAMGQVKYG